jgi:hypothetical protein
MAIVKRKKSGYKKIKKSFFIFFTRVDSENIISGLWIRIRIGSGFSDFVDPDPDPYWESGSGSRGKKIKKFQWKKCTF